jgi:hypothetical protein
MDTNCFVFWTTQSSFLFLNPRRIQMVLWDKPGIINETLELNFEWEGSTVLARARSYGNTTDGLHSSNCSMCTARLEEL